MQAPDVKRLTNYLSPARMKRKQCTVGKRSLSHFIHQSSNFLIFTSFVSRSEKRRKRSQGKENQKVIIKYKLRMQFSDLF